MKHKYSFLNDYSEGAHQNVLTILQESNSLQTPGYSEDFLSQQAADLIKHKIANLKAKVHFVSGGTQANLTVLSAIMKPYESVIAVNTAHISTHETGAIEATGHKINTVDSADGKIIPTKIQEICDAHSDEHMVKPKVVFISNATEVGTLYSKHELQAISSVCKQKNLYLYLDGARLGSALTAINNDMKLNELSEFVDIFYIGGTKNGALLGEAIVINNTNLQENFRYSLKQKGALLAKSRILGAQFLALFRDNLYYKLAEHANKMATYLKEGIQNQGYELLSDSTTNQIFPIFPDVLVDKLKTLYRFYIWKKYNNKNVCIRLVTSWATQKEAVDKFLSDLLKNS
jgi:threonine aldolase